MKQEEGDVNELPHNLGTALPTPGGDDEDGTVASPPKKRAKRSNGKNKAEDVKEEIENLAVKAEDMGEAADEASPKKKQRTPKKPNYGLTPGLTPYSDYARPTFEECHEVVRLLSEVHGKVHPPKEIPIPSLDVSGCGEVPSVLDALIRTRLSANTTNKNSSTAFQGLVKRFGILQEGIGKGSVNWDAVRRAPQKEVFNAIERGGLANIKSRDIQKILQMTYEDNQARRAEHKDAKVNPAGADREPESEKTAEIERAENNVLSLDHIHLLSTPDAINRMLEFPGIGAKTASCVALFCLQRPSFAVDTHVFRLCRYLGWVPERPKAGQPKVDRNTTYSHCEVRIPDELKYALHQLLIKHGKTCPRCRAITGQGSADWEKGCPIEHLVTRHGAKKGGVGGAAKKKGGKKAKVEDDDEEEEAESSELSDLASDEE